MLVCLDNLDQLLMHVIAWIRLQGTKKTRGRTASIPVPTIGIPSGVNVQGPPCEGCRHRNGAASGWGGLWVTDLREMMILFGSKCC